MVVCGNVHFAALPDAEICSRQVVMARRRNAKTCSARGSDWQSPCLPLDMLLPHDILLPVSHRRLVLTLWVVMLVIPATARVQEFDEAPPRVKAAGLLTSAVAQGAHYRVGEDVRTEGYFHEFTISSDFGPFEAIGRSRLAVRIQEIGALAALQDVSKTEVFLTAAGQSVVQIGQNAAAVVTDPVETAKGVGAGVKRFGTNLGRRTQRAVESARDGNDPDDPTATTGKAGASAARGVLAVSAAMRRWAQKVGVDPYTTNPVLQKALADIARVDAAGSIATKVVVPIPGIVGMTSTIGNLVWGKDPEALRKFNEQGLRDLAVPDAVAKKLNANRWITLTYQTRLVAALRAVPVRGVADYVRTAAESVSEREILFFVESAEMLQRWHAREPVVSVLTDSRALVAKGAGARARVLLPLDWISWTAPTESALREISTRARKELGASRFEVALTGSASDLARRRLTDLGWTVVPAATDQ
jgi:hypothetical protein